MEKLDPLQMSVIELIAHGVSFSEINRRLGIYNSWTVFEAGRSRFLRGKGSGPFLSEKMPFSIADWRADTCFSMQLLNLHQSACDAAHREYWRVFGEIAEALTESVQNGTQTNIMTTAKNVR